MSPRGTCGQVGPLRTSLGQQHGADAGPKGPFSAGHVFARWSAGPTTPQAAPRSFSNASRGEAASGADPLVQQLLPWACVPPPCSSTSAGGATPVPAAASVSVHGVTQLAACGMPGSTGPYFSSGGGLPKAAPHTVPLMHRLNALRDVLAAEMTGQGQVSGTSIAKEGPNTQTLLQILAAGLSTVDNVQLETDTPPAVQVGSCADASTHGGCDCGPELADQPDKGGSGFTQAMGAVGIEPAAAATQDVSAPGTASDWEHKIAAEVRIKPVVEPTTHR